MSKFVPQGMGWIPDLPDPRDFNYQHPEIEPLLRRLRRSPERNLPSQMDLRSDDEGEYFTPPENQDSLNCSTAFAVLSLIEYFERRVWGKAFDGSTRFLYKVTRNQLRVTGDTGADLRSTIKALMRFGVPPEEYWPYDVRLFDEEPSQFMYGMAERPIGTRYFRLDVPNCDGAATLAAVKSFVHAGFPVAFGYSVPATISADANLPYRCELDSVRGGQASIVVGYRSNQYGRGQDALMIRNSWGSEWGDHGIGLLPIQFVLNQLAVGFWTMINEAWIHSCDLCRPLIVDSL